jgi:hypothetical protein
VRLRYTAGAIDTVGGVDDGPTRTDSSEIERHTIDHRDARYDDLCARWPGGRRPRSSAPYARKNRHLSKM